MARLLSAVLFLFLTATCFAQIVYDGNNNLPPFGGFSGSDFDIVSLQNGNLHISIPIVDVPERGGKPVKYSFLYDAPAYTRIYHPGSTSPPSPDGTTVAGPGMYSGWGLTNSLAWVTSGGSVNSAVKCPGDTTHVYTTSVTTGVMDPERSVHPIKLQKSTAPCNQTVAKGPTLDGSGVYADISSTPVITLKDGTKITQGVAGNPLSNLLEDPNGNLQTATADTVNRNPLVIANGPNVSFTTPLGKTVPGTHPQYQTWTYNDSNGTSQTWRVDYVAIDISTGLCGSIPRCRDISGNINGSFIVPSRLTLPTQRFYQFTWNNNSSGEIQRIDLPTGGYIAYTYSGQRCQHNPFEPVDGSQTFDCRAAVGTRSVVQGGVTATWTYNANKVTDPYGNDELHVFSSVGPSAGTYETQVQYWLGSSASGAGGTLLKTVNTQYTYETILGSIYSTSVNVRPISQTTVLENNQTRGTQTDYETFTDPGWGGFIATRMNPTAVREYDYGSGAIGPLKRQTTFSYKHTGNSVYINANIVDRVTVKTIKDGGGAQITQTVNEYDGYSHPNQAMVASGTIQHDSAYSTSFTTRGNLTAVQQWRNTDGAMLTTTNQYDDAGNLLSTIDPLGHKTSYDYTDSWGNATCAPSGQGKAYVTTITNALSQATTKTYNSCSGTLASSKDPNLQITNLSYDLLNRVKQVSLPGGGQTNYCHSDDSTDTCYSTSTPLKVVQTDKITSGGVNRVQTSIFDDLGRVKQAQLNSDPDGVTYTDTSYDLVGRKSVVSNPYRTTSDSTYGNTSYTYDALSRPCVVAPPDKYPGPTSCPTNAPTGDVFTSYSGNTTTVTDEAGKSRKSKADGLGRLTAVWEDPSGVNWETDYQYDTLDNLLRVDQKGGDANSANWRTRTFSYNSLSQILCAANPEIATVTCPNPDNGQYTTGTIRYSYDADGNVSTKTAPKPNQTGSATVITTYNYDVLNRLIQKSYNDGSTQSAFFSYDTCCWWGFSQTNTIGRLQEQWVGTSCCANAAEIFGYDAMGRVNLNVQCTPADCSAPNHAVNYTYDLIGDMTSSGNGSGGITYSYSYNSAARLVGVTSSLADSNHPGTLLSNAHYDPFSHETSATLGNGTALAGMNENRSYNNRGFLTSSTSGVIGGPGIYNMLNVTYTSNGNLMRVDDSILGGTWNYTYDALNRLSTLSATNTSYGSSLGFNYTYDAWGNRLHQDVTAGSGPNPVFTFDAKNHIQGAPANCTNSVIYCYDAAGNLLNDGFHSYSYDAENRIVSVDNGATTYLYDAGGNRVQKTTGTSALNFVHDLTGRNILEYTSTTINRDEIYAGRRHLATYSAGLTFFNFQDQVGTERVKMTQDGAHAESTASLPFGDGQINWGNNVSSAGPAHFTGKERDTESGLDEFGARYYASTLGRFMQVDPVALTVQRLNDPQQLNLFIYARNNPLKYIDPDGEIIDFANNASEVAFGEYYNSLDKNSQEFKTLTTLLNSDVTYLVKVGGGNYPEGEEGRTEPSKDGNSIDVNIKNEGNGHERFSLNGRFAHELEHARQFDNGEVSFLKNKNGQWMANPSSYDIFDEVKAFQAQLNVAPQDGGPRGLLRDFANAKSNDERAGVLVRLSDNYRHAANQERNVNYPGRAPGELVKSTNGIGVNHP